MMMMKVIRRCLPWMVITGCIGIFVSCEDPLAAQESEVKEIYNDSVAQSATDFIIIDNYLNRSEYSGYTIYDIDVINEMPEGLKFIILDEGDGERYPEVNDIVSIDYVAHYETDSIFDTSYVDLAMEVDSLAYVSNGINVGAVKAALDYDLDQALEHINLSNDGLDFPVFRSAQPFDPINFNYTGGDDTISETFIEGFRIGLAEMIQRMSVGGEGIILIPSALGYGVGGSSSGRVGPDRVLIFEIYFDKIRP